MINNMNVKYKFLIKSLLLPIYFDCKYEDPYLLSFRQFYQI